MVDDFDVPHLQFDWPRGGEARVRGYEVLREGRAVERHLFLPDAAVERRTWYLRLGKACYYVSWISLNPEGTGPECMAFRCDGDGEVADWSAAAVSYAPNSNEAFAEVTDQLLA